MTDRRSRIEMRQSSSPEASAEHLAEVRKQFAGDWLALRRSLRLETGSEPRWSSHLVLPVLALAAGVAVGAGIWWRRAKRD
jgi:hypothetical protein